MKKFDFETVVDRLGTLALILTLASLVSACASTKPRYAAGDCRIIQTGRQSYRCEPMRLTWRQHETVNKLSRELASRGASRKARPAW